jgi:hypothetical protein
MRSGFILRPVAVADTSYPVIVLFKSAAKMRVRFTSFRKGKKQTMSDSEDYDPLKRTSHSTAELKKLLLDGPRLQRTKTENPGLYETYRKQFVEHGLIADRPVWADPNYRDRFDEKPLSEDAIKLRATISESEVRSYYTHKSDSQESKDLNKLAMENPERYRMVREAAMEYGLVPRQAIPRQPDPKPASTTTTLTLPNDVCDRRRPRRMPPLTRVWQRLATSAKLPSNLRREPTPLPQRKTRKLRLPTTTTTIVNDHC